MTHRPTRRRRGDRTTLVSLRTGRPLAPVRTLSAKELRDELVEDACAGVAGGEPYLRRQVAAYVRIAKLERRPVEEVTREVFAEVAARGHLLPLL
jgi:hypothetical protein